MCKNDIINSDKNWREVMMERNNILYHGSYTVVNYPELRLHKFTKDFSWGFYCTKNKNQAERFTKKYGDSRVISIYSLSNIDGLNIKSFNEINDEWLDFIASCRAGETHDYDVVEGPMADDVIWDYANEYLAGKISRAAFMELARFRTATHQISFHTIKALARLKFERSYMYDEKTK